MRPAVPSGSPGVWIAAIEAATLRDRLRGGLDRLPHVYLESARQALFAPLHDFLDDSPSVPIDRWRAGRAFGAQFELRWRMTDSLRMSVELLIETGSSAQQLPLTDIVWRPGGWEGRLNPIATPREMLLIAPPGGRLRALDYRDRQFGVVVLTRLCDWLPD
jgi:hypothetical protein